MSVFKIDQKLLNSESLPDFTIEVDHSSVTSLYSDAELQGELVHAFYKVEQVQVFDFKENIYHRLSVEDNLKFYWKWFACTISLPEILVMFQLQHCANKPIKDCSLSEKRRLYYAKYLMACTVSPVVFVEPIHGVDAITIETFFSMLKKMRELKIPICILLTNMEHALLLSDKAYRLQDTGLFPIEVEEETVESTEESATKFSIHNLSKIPAKIEDKVILFDPLEIDYIESQDGKAYLVINEDSFILDSTLADIEKKLEIYGFYRCHRSYIVNLQKVREIITWSKNTYSLRIDNKVQSTIPLSRTKVQEIQAIFSLR